MGGREFSSRGRATILVLCGEPCIRSLFSSFFDIEGDKAEREERVGGWTRLLLSQCLCYRESQEIGYLVKDGSSRVGKKYQTIDVVMLA